MDCWAHPHAIGEAIHITSDEWLTWNEIARLWGGVDVEPEIVHVPSDTITGYDAEWGMSLLGDKAHSTVFDNAKIKRLVPEFEARHSVRPRGGRDCQLVRCPSGRHARWIAAF